jgi:hypothetical protein
LDLPEHLKAFWKTPVTGKTGTLKRPRLRKCQSVRKLYIFSRVRPPVYRLNETLEATCYQGDGGGRNSCYAN